MGADHRDPTALHSLLIAELLRRDSNPPTATDLGIAHDERLTRAND
jgi:hypothetical protein